MARASFWRFSMTPARSFRLHRPLATVLPPLTTILSPLARSRPLPTDPRKSGSFTCSILTWFVLIRNVTTSNDRAIWLRFGPFLSPPASWPSASLTTGHDSLALRPTTPKPAGSGHAQILPRRLLRDTDSRSTKDRTGPDLEDRSLYIQDRSLYIQYVTEPGDFFHRNPRLLSCWNLEEPHRRPRRQVRCLVPCHLINGQSMGIRILDLDVDPLIVEGWAVGAHPLDLECQVIPK